MGQSWPRGTGSVGARGTGSVGDSVGEGSSQPSKQHPAPSTQHLFWRTRQQGVFQRPASTAAPLRAGRPV